MATIGTETAELWAVHVEGSDDVQPTATRERAERVAAEVNCFLAAYSAKFPDDAAIHPNLRAVVVAWDGTPEAHAAEVERLERDGYDG